MPSLRRALVYLPGPPPVSPPTPPPPVTAPVLTTPIQVQPGWSAYVYDLVTNTKVAEVPIELATFTETLNAPGSFEVTLPVWSDLAGSTVFEPGATSVIFDDSGQIRFAGICWQTEADFTDQMTFVARGQGYISYYTDGPQGPRRTIQSRLGMSYAQSSTSITYSPTGDALQLNVVGFPDTSSLFNNVIPPANFVSYIRNHGNPAIPDNPFTPEDESRPADQSAYHARFGGIPSGFYTGATGLVVSVEIVAGVWSHAIGIAARVVIAGVPYDSPSVLVTQPGSQNYVATWIVNPATGLPWTGADVEAFATTSAAGFVTTPVTVGDDSSVFSISLTISGSLGGIDVTFNAVDQFLVVGDMIDHAAAVAAGADAGYDDVIFHGSSPSSTPRGNLSDRTWTRTYWGYENKGIGQAINEISQRFNGFDYSDSWAWDYATMPPTPRRFLNLWFPRRGVADSGIVLELGTNIAVGKHTRDGSGLANPLKGLGAGTADAELTSIALDTSLLHPSARYPYVEGKYDANEEAIQTNLNDRTLSKLSRTKLPVDTLHVEVLPTANFEIGDIGVGDALDAILIPPAGGWSFIGRVRIVQQSISITADGLDKWELDLALDGVSTGQF